MFFVTLVFQLIDVILQIVEYVVIAQVIASWLVAFGVLNTRNQIVYTIVDFLDRATRPILRPLRRMIPPMGGLDLSPLVLFLLIDFVLRPILAHIYAQIAFS